MIAKTRFGNVAVEQRVASINGLNDIIRASGGTPRSGIGVTYTEVAGLPAWKQAIRIAAEAIAKHRMCVWRGEDAQRRRVTSTWQARFFAGQPNELYPWFIAWEMTEASLTGRSNAFWLKMFDDAQRVAAIHVLHPDHVRMRWNRELRRPEYRVLVEGGLEASPWFSTADVVHFRLGHPAPGSLAAPTPIEEHRRALGSALAKARAEETFYDGGSMKTTAIVFPSDVTPEQAERWKNLYLGAGGITGGSQVKVFGGDPRIETIGLSLSDQQFIESQAFAIEDVGRILGVTPSLLWAASKEGSKPITPEHEEDRWVRYGLSPRRLRISTTIGHDPSFFGAGARDYPEFTAPQVSGDLLTEDAIAHQQVQDGRVLVDEWRASKGMPPLPDGLGMIPQIVPVGGAPNPQPTAAAADDD